MENQEQKIKEILQNLPQEFKDLYDLKICINVYGERLNIDLNRISLPMPTKIKETTSCFEFYGKTYSLTLWKKSKIKHLVVFE